MSPRAGQNLRLTTELSEACAQLGSVDRLAELGRVATHIAHEAQGQLTTVGLYLRLLRRRLSDDPGSVDVLNKIESSLLGLEAAFHDVQQFVADRPPRWERIRLRQLVDEICAQHEARLLEQHVRVDIDVPLQESLLADRELLCRCITNLVRNALDAMPSGGEVVITSYSGAAGFELEIADSGPGIDAELRRRAFEPFFTTKPGSAGLGLSVVAQIAAAHGGQVTAQNCPEGGAAFTLRFPRRSLEAAA